MTQDKSHQSFLVFVPGMGADARLFIHQTEVFENSAVLPWLPVSRKDTLKSYLRRLVLESAVFHSPKISEKDVILCGVSFGGILAPFIAEASGCKKVILISSTENPKDIPSFYLFLARMACKCRILFNAVLTTFKFLLSVVAILLKLFKRKSAFVVVRQFVETPNEQLYGFIQMLRMPWPELDVRGHNDAVEIRRIHGVYDHIITAGDDTTAGDDVGYKVNGGHLICLTKHRETNSAISCILEGFTCRTDPESRLDRGQ